jgi:hypothetical protein
MQAEPEQPVRKVPKPIRINSVIFSWYIRFKLFLIKPPSEVPDVHGKDDDANHPHFLQYTVVFKLVIFAKIIIIREKAARTLKEITIFVAVISPES